jgi:hypothetical protein
MLHLKLLEKQERPESKTGRRREIIEVIKIRAQINKKETKKTIQRVNEKKKS